jgi:hypothetical protein
MLPLVQSGLPTLRRLCEQYHVDRLDLFGSAATGSFDDASSDLDFVVQFGPDEACDLFDRFFGLQAELQSLFGRDIDLVTDRSIRNPYFRQVVDRTRLNLYDARPAPVSA